MIGLVFAASALATVPQLEACERAVRTDLPAAVSACALPKGSLDLFGPNPLTFKCQQAFEAGEQAGKVGPRATEQMRKVLLNNFETKLQECKFPKKEPETPVRDTVTLWD